MTGEQKPGGLEVVAWGRFAADGKLLDLSRLSWGNYEPLCRASSAEARVRELEIRRDFFKRNMQLAEARATAAEAQLAKAKEALEKTRDHFDFLVRMASGSAVFEIVDGKRVRRNLGEVIASEADEGSKFARQTLAALQQEGE